MATVRLDVPSSSKDVPGVDATIDRDSQFYKDAVEATLDGGRTDFYDVAHLKGKRMYWIETDVQSPKGDPNADHTDMIGAIISPTRKGKFSLPTRALPRQAQPSLAFLERTPKSASAEAAPRAHCSCKLSVEGAESVSCLQKRLTVHSDSVYARGSQVPGAVAVADIVVKHLLGSIFGAEPLLHICQFTQRPMCQRVVLAQLGLPPLPCQG